jgi:hypothetical protein
MYFVHSSEDQQVQEYGTGIFFASGEGLMLYHSLAEKQKGKWDQAEKN